LIVQPQRRMPLRSAQHHDRRLFAMPETTFHLPTLRTQEDADAVMFELQDLPCVAQAEVDLATQTAWVAHTAMISPEDILAALAEAGLLFEAFALDDRVV
jgi:copper chaperone CopZ